MVALNQQYKLPTTGDSSTRTQTRTITIPGLTKLNAVTVDTGNVAHTIDGETISLTCTNGSYVRQSTSTYYPSKYVTYTEVDEENNGVPEFPYSISYSSGNYTGVLYKSGGVIEETITIPPDFRTETATRTCSVQTTFRCSGSSPNKHWAVYSNTYSGYPASVSYNSGGYSGTLSHTSNSGSAPSPTYNANDYPVGTMETRTSGTGGTARYSGTVATAAGSRKRYSQGYSGYAYDYTSPSYSTTNYYAYTVNIEYESFSQIGSIKAASSNKVYTIPIYSPDKDLSAPFRINTPRGVGVFGIVGVESESASPLRIKTKNGIESIAYSEIAEIRVLSLMNAAIDREQKIENLEIDMQSSGNYSSKMMASTLSNLVDYSFDFTLDFGSLAKDIKEVECYFEFSENSHQSSRVYYNGEKCRFYYPKCNGSGLTTLFFTTHLKNGTTYNSSAQIYV